MTIQFARLRRFSVDLLTLHFVFPRFYYCYSTPHRFPVNIVVAKLSQKYEDRELISAALIVMLISVFGIIDYLPDQYSVYQYIIFGVGCFISANSLEGVNMALLSKTIPTSWAKGTFNSGFLATEAGTLARSIGDILISTVMALFGMENLLDGLFTPMALLCAISLVMVYFSYNQLTDMDDDDDFDSKSNTSNESGLENLK
jgi:MFS family permease